jgi:hypothetical protein
MSLEDEFEILINNLGLCLRQARAMQLQHAVHLLNMAVMEVADRSIERPGKPGASTESPLQPHFRQEN